MHCECSFILQNHNMEICVKQLMEEFLILEQGEEFLLKKSVCLLKKIIITHKNL